MCTLEERIEGGKERRKSVECCWEDDVDGGWYALHHYERVSALAEKWNAELGIDDFSVKLLKEGIRDRPKMPKWMRGRCLVFSRQLKSWKLQLVAHLL